MGLLLDHTGITHFHCHGRLSWMALYTTGSKGRVPGPRPVPGPQDAFYRYFKLYFYIHFFNVCIRSVSSNLPLSYFQNVLPNSSLAPSPTSHTQLVPQARRKPLASPVHHQILRYLPGSHPLSPKQRGLVQPQHNPRSSGPQRTGLEGKRTPGVKETLLGVFSQLPLVTESPALDTTCHLPLTPGP